MFRKLFAPAMLAVLIVPGAWAGESQGATAAITRVEAAPERAPSREVTLKTLLEARSETVMKPGGMMVLRSPRPHVLVARINSDGSRETACVVALKAAEHFLQRAQAVEADSSREK